jgi:hypothetical protein
MTKPELSYYQLTISQTGRSGGTESVDKHAPSVKYAIAIGKLRAI